MTRYMLALLLFAFPAIVAAQEPSGEAEVTESRIQLEEPAKTVKEAMERRESKLAIAQKELDAAQRAYDENQAAIDRLTVVELAVTARLAVAEGLLGEAAEAWTAVEQLDPENEQAKAFFKVVGREEPATKKPTRIRGDNRRVWSRDGSGRHSFVLQKNGTWSEFSEAGRLQANWEESYRDEFVIELKRPDGAVRIHPGTYYYTTDGENWRGGARGRWN